MALFERPTLQHAKALFSLLVDGVRGSGRAVEPAPGAPPPLEAQRERRVRTEPARVPSSVLRDPDFAGIGASHEPGGLLLSWRTTPEQLDGAAQLGGGVPSLRLVIMRAERGDVAVDTLDLGAVPREGARLVPELPDALFLVASVGLFDGSRFVSMAHTRVG
jgi:hypothetical protein